MTLLPKRHSFHLFTECAPVVSLQLRIPDPFLTPIHMQLADVILRLLKVDNLVSNALLDEHAARVLRDDRLLVLRGLLAPS